MKTAKEILEKNASALQPQSWTSTTPIGDENAQQNTGATIDQETKSLINMVFTRFMAIYGHKFKSSFESDAEIRIAKREWAMSLSKYSENELVAAVSICKETLAWAPSISEFISILKDLNSSLGLPDVRSAYREACFYGHIPSSHNWSHPVVYAAGKETGWFELRSLQEKEIYPQFSYHYDIMCRRFRQGDILEQPVAVAIEDKQNTTICTFINSWSVDNGFSAKQGSSLLYYMTKLKGSKVRESFKLQSQAKVDAMGLDIQLPE
jgi:hypothetical protein